MLRSRLSSGAAQTLSGKIDGGEFSNSCVRRPPLMESASSASPCHPLPSQALTNTVGGVSPTDGSLSSQFKRALSLSPRKWIGWCRKQKARKLCTREPLRTRSRVVWCAPLFRRCRAGPIIEESAIFFFFFALHQHVTRFKAGCHSASRLQSHCRRLSVASIANSETKSRRPCPRLVIDFLAFP